MTAAARVGLRRFVLVGMLTVLLVASFALWGPSGSTSEAEAATPIRLGRASWSECHEGPRTLQGPYWTGRRWLVDVQRGGGTFTLECRRTIYKRAYQ
jgi:hypothetical protein